MPGVLQHHDGHNHLSLLPQRFSQRLLAADGQYWRRIVKMVKKWNQTNEKPVTPSFLLEVMALLVFVPPFSGGYRHDDRSYSVILDRAPPDNERIRGARAHKHVSN